MSFGVSGLVPRVMAMRSAPYLSILDWPMPEMALRAVRFWGQRVAMERRTASERIEEGWGFGGAGGFGAPVAELLEEGFGLGGEGLGVLRAPP